MDYKTLKTDFQRELLFFIILNMKRGKITKSYARKIAKALLPIFKSETVDSFLLGIEKICRYSPEITDAFIRITKEYEMQTRVGKLETVRESLMPQMYAMKGGE